MEDVYICSRCGVTLTEENEGAFVFVQLPQGNDGVVIDLCEQCFTTLKEVFTDCEIV